MPNNKFVRDACGRFATMTCQKQHDLCYRGGNCEWCLPENKATQEPKDAKVETTR